MAVWIYAYGANGLLSENNNDNQKYIDVLNTVPLDEVTFLDSIRPRTPPGEHTRKHYEEHREQLDRWLESLTAADYNAYLDSIKYPRIEKAKLVDYFIADAIRREQEDLDRFNAAYALSRDGRAKSTWEPEGERHFINRVHEFGNRDGLRLNLINDLVRITGSSDIFSHFGTFLHDISPATKEFYHDYFKRVLRAFKSDFILYTHEWTGLDDEDNEAFDLAELKESSNWEVTSSDTIHTMKDFYYEGL
ncbi:hypothetical protein [Taibaiella koreensis]|uniref:hypothetical protein n=1 Tax=Taibaiella koreensis TaxID=1268548 RepID=UPI000E59909A|nr:hypothetical protein [Taibaiella koreensis]